MKKKHRKLRPKVGENRRASLGEYNSSDYTDMSDTDSDDMNTIHWSLKDLPHFYGKKDGTENPSSHLDELDDFLKATE